MRVSYELTRDDYAALTFAKAPPRRTTRLRLLVLGVLIGVVLGLMALLTWLTGGLAWIDDLPGFRLLLWVTASVLAAFLALTALLAGLRLWVRRLPRDDGATLGRHELEVGEDGLHVEGRSGRAFVRWSAIVELRETDEHVFLYVDRMLAYVVPKRAFGDGAELERFLGLARARISKGA